MGNEIKNCHHHRKIEHAISDNVIAAASRRLSHTTRDAQVALNKFMSTVISRLIIGRD